MNKNRFFFICCRFLGFAGSTTILLKMKKQVHSSTLGELMNLFL